MKSNLIEFGKFKLKTSKDVFSPRVDIEIFPKAIKNLLKSYNKIIELGTGTGAISIAIAKNFENIDILATDINQKALTIAKYNAQMNKVSNKIKFINSNWFSKIDAKKEKFDFIITNPPYLSKKNKIYYSELIDPNNSLYSDNDGLADIQKIIKKSVHYLKDDSYLIIEHSHYQTLLIKEYAYNNNLKYVESLKDNLGFNRISIFSNIF